MIFLILSILSFILTVYSFLCFLCVIMSWIPGLKFTAFGRFLDSLCSPYLNLFSRISFLRFGNIDFSPVISIGLLVILSATLGEIQSTGRIYIAGIFISLISMIFNAIHSLLIIFTLLVLIRWIFLKINHGRTEYDSGWNQVDLMIKNVSYKIGGTFFKGSLSYERALLITWISSLVTIIALKVMLISLIKILSKIPY